MNYSNKNKPRKSRETVPALIIDMKTVEVLRKEQAIQGMLAHVAALRSDIIEIDINDGQRSEAELAMWSSGLFVMDNDATIQNEGFSWGWKSFWSICRGKNRNIHLELKSFNDKRNIIIPEKYLPHPVYKGLTYSQNSERMRKEILDVMKFGVGTKATLHLDIKNGNIHAHKFRKNVLTLQEKLRNNGQDSQYFIIESSEKGITLATVAEFNYMNGKFDFKKYYLSNAEVTSWSKDSKLSKLIQKDSKGSYSFIVPIPQLRSLYKRIGDKEYR